MNDDIQELRKRVDRIEQTLGIERTERVESMPTRLEMPLSASEPPSPRPYSPRVTKDTFFGRSGEDLEAYIGQRWLPVIGIIAVILGASFFLKYAFDSNLIGVTGRVLLGLAGGLLFVVLGEVFHSKEKYEKYSWILSGGGIALFYLSLFAAYSFYGILSQGRAFSFMIGVTAFAGILSIRYNAMPLAVVAVIGGFLTPFLVSSGHDNQIGLFGYITFLNFGVLFVAAFRNWRPLNLLGLVGTAFSFLAWYAAYYTPEKLFLTESFFTIFFIEYVCATVLGNLFSAEESKEDDLGLLTANAAWYFGWSYYLLKPDYEPYLGLFTAGLALLYVILAYSALSTKPSDKKLGLFLGAIALVFLTLVFPIQFERHWVTIAWAVEAAVLTAVGFMVVNSDVRFGAFVILGIALVRLILFNSGTGPIDTYTIIFNDRVLTYMIVIFAVFIMHYLYTSNRDKWLVPREEKATVALAGIWNVLLLSILSLEIVAYFSQQMEFLRHAPDNSYKYGTVSNTYNSAEYRSLINKSNASLSVLWALYATAALIVGMIKNNKAVRIGSLMLFGLTIAKVVIIDLANLPQLYRFISFMVLGLLLLVGSYLYYRNQSRISSS
jgi:uncharacterized membrane protein